jgi:hypothetical protein
MKENDSPTLDFSVKGTAKRSSLFGFFGLFPTMLIWIQSEELGASLFSVYASLALTAMFIVIPILFSFHKRGEPTLASTYGWLVVIGFVS